jgi:hypothetical protein
MLILIQQNDNDHNNDNDNNKEGDLKGWFTVLVTALGSWEKTVPCGH